MRADRLQRLDRALDQRLGYVSCAIEAVYHRHNASAILRTCESLGVQRVHLVAQDFRVSKGAAHGAGRWLDLHRHATAAEAVAAIRDAGFDIWIADLAVPPALPVPPEEVPLDRPVCLWFGAELVGVGPEAKAAATGVVTVPMRGLSQSLNVSVAAALTLRPVAERARGLGDRALLSPAQREAIREAWIDREKNPDKITTD